MLAEQAGESGGAAWQDRLRACRTRPGARTSQRCLETGGGAPRGCRRSQSLPPGHPCSDRCWPGSSLTILT